MFYHTKENYQDKHPLTNRIEESQILNFINTLDPHDTLKFQVENSLVLLYCMNQSHTVMSRVLFGFSDIEDCCYEIREGLNTIQSIFEKLCVDPNYKICVDGNKLLFEREGNFEDLILKIVERPQSKLFQFNHNSATERIYLQARDLKLLISESYRFCLKTDENKCKALFYAGKFNKEKIDTVISFNNFKHVKSKGNGVFLDSTYVSRAIKKLDLPYSHWYVDHFVKLCWGLDHPLYLEYENVEVLIAPVINQE